MAARYVQGIDLVYSTFTRLFNYSLVLLQRCPKNHPAYRQLYSIMTTQRWNSSMEAKNAIHYILEFRSKYPELLRQEDYINFFNSMLPLLNCLNDAKDGERDYRIPYGI